VEYSPDGSKVLSVSSDQRMVVHSASSGQPLLPPFTPAAAACFSPDGESIVIASAVTRHETDQSVLEGRGGTSRSQSASYIQRIDSNTGARIGPAHEPPSILTSAGRGERPQGRAEVAVYDEHHMSRTRWIPGKELVAWSIWWTGDKGVSSSKASWTG